MSNPDDARLQLVQIATAMIEGKLHLLEGARRLCRLRPDSGDPENPAFLPMIAVESETDHLPLGDERVRCSVDFLRRIDDEVERYLVDERSHLLEYCREIVRVFSPQSKDK